jgi:xanthine dehydrogenase/oxidase
VFGSINPTIDVGQIEGAFVMGLGAFLSEDLHYNKRTGELINDGTWVSYGSLFTL